MTGRRSSLKVVDEPVYEGKIVIREKQSTELDMLNAENNHAINMRKMDVAMNVVEIGKQLVNILAIQQNGKAKIKEIDAHIRQLEQVMYQEVALRRQNRKTIESKGKVVADILSKLTPILANPQLSTENQKHLIEMFERTIEKAVQSNE